MSHCIDSDMGETMADAAPKVDSWSEVERLRREAEHYARWGDMLASALLDRQASTMTERLQAKDTVKR